MFDNDDNQKGHKIPITDGESAPAAPGTPVVDAAEAHGDARDVLSVRAVDYAKQFEWGRVIDAYLEEIEQIRRKS